jgi:glycine dehydrogenase subunit 1
MPYIPHTDAEVDSMLRTIGVDAIETLFDEIPKALTCEPLNKIPEGISELALNQLVKASTSQMDNGACYIGAGAYEHHIPACVWDIVSRGEFLTAYTPYQAEASQGTLQLLYEYQTMMSSLTAMEVSNASLYDGASSLAEAVLMAVRANKKSKSKRILVLGGLHPHYLDTTKTIVCNQNIELVSVDFDREKGTSALSAFDAYQEDDVTAIVIQQPNFFGSLEDVDALTDWAHKKNAFVIAVVNPMSLALLKPPGQWGEMGADIVCGEGQPLGVPLASGGPYFGFMTAKQKYVRQMPGRIVGRTLDSEGKEGFSLTLQAREQHIRRSKATSNICTNQGLLVTAATIFTSLMGYEGLHRIAATSHQNTHDLLTKLEAIPGVKRLFSAPFFHEVAITVPKPVDNVIKKMKSKGIACGLSLKPYHDALGEAMIVCVTETKTQQDLDKYVRELTAVLKED